MNQTLRHLLVAAAIGVTSLGATAQTATTTPYSTPSNTTTVGTNLQAEADYRAAVTACDAKTGAAKAACLSDAEKARDQAMSSGQGTSGTSSGTSSSAGTSTGASGGTGPRGTSDSSGGTGSGQK